MITTIAFVSTMIIVFVLGVAGGIFATCKAIASGKVKNVKVVE